MISLVVPVYNMEKYLQRCMNALLAQTVCDYEIILVDDGSTDSSPQLCDNYAQSYSFIRVVHKKNGGLSSARNAGIDAARGQYIIFPDPDDWVEPNYLQTLTALQEQYQPDLACIGHFIDYDTVSIPANKDQKQIVLDRKQAQRSLFAAPCMNGFAWNKLYQLKIIRDNKLYFGDDVGTTEDMDFAYRYLKHCERVCFAPEIRCYHYYQRPGAATHSGFSRKKLDSVHTYEKIAADTDDTELCRMAEEEICNTALNLLWMFCNDKCRDESAKQELKAYLKRYTGRYLRSKRFGRNRKLQLICARISPRLYCAFKNITTKG